MGMKFKSLILLILLPYGAVWGNCGLEYCDVKLRSHSDRKITIELPVYYQWTQFKAYDKKGSYQEIFAKAQIGFPMGFTFDLSQTILFLNYDDSYEKGMGNLVMTSNKLFKFSDSAFLSLGLQLELPTGDDEKGIVADHYEVLPFFQFQKRGKLNISTSLGFRFSIEDDESSHAGGSQKKYHSASDDSLHKLDIKNIAMVYVNPHEDQELLWRVDLSYSLKPWYEIHGRFYSQTVISDTERDDFFLSLSVKNSFELNRFCLFEVSFELPLLDERRYEGKLGMLLKMKF